MTESRSIAVRPSRGGAWRAAACLLLAGAVGCNGAVLVPDSVCEVAEDCDDFPACAWREGGCECRDSQCYFDPEAPYQEYGCRGCHGGLDNAAPPTSLGGETSTDAVGVGAHQTHLRPGTLARTMSCEECHVVPEAVGDEGHIDDALPAEVTFGALAGAGGQIAVWDPTSRTCTNYCHGASLAGGSNQQPQWTVVDGTQAACGTCHGAPPGGSHPHDNACERCHAPTAGPNLSIADPRTHVDGVVQITGGGCAGCHGDDSRPEPLNAAPPRDLAGNLVSDQVGAHQRHLSPTNAADVACTSCHVVPQTYGAPGHDDGDGTAEVIFAGRAIAGGGAPAATYDGATLRCRNTYCHGVITTGGSNGDQAVWNAGSAAAQCDACHGLPPATPGHLEANVQPTDPCGACHDDTASATLPATITQRQYHVDGTLQMAACGSSCHGVPPTTGAHTRHAGTLGFECATCHGHNGSGPTHIQDTVVVRANVDIVFADRSFAGGTTIGNGGSPSYDMVTQRCTVGCHNPVPGNPDETPNLANRPTWASGTINCRACHDQIGGAPPQNHQVGDPDRQGCSHCHDLGAHTEGTVVLADPDPADGFVPTLGTIDPQCQGCHDGGAGTFFGGQSPVDVLVGWNASAHGADGMHCSDCHTYHVSTNNSAESFVDGGFQLCVGSGCHASILAPPNGPFSFANSHHAVGEGTDQLRCVSCHNPHLVKAPPNAATDPDDPWTLVAYPTIAASQRISDGITTRGFCLSCHDGSPPPGVPASAMNIQQALSGGTDPSQFEKEGESLHRKEHNRWNCVTCHDWHGAAGTQGINRGRTLVPFITVNQFPYTGKSSCGTSGAGRIWNGTWIPYSFGCH